MLDDITGIQYANEGQTRIKITYSDGVVSHAIWPNRTWHGDIIQQWLDGKSLAWIEQDIAYRRYQDVVTYEQRVADWLAESEANSSNPDYVPSSSYPSRPFGYYSTEEVAKSVAAHNAWLACQASDPGNCGNEPVVLKRPNELPVVSAPDALVPRDIQPWKTADEILTSAKEEQKQKITNQRDKRISAGLLHAGYAFDTDAKSVQRIMGAVLLAHMAQVEGTEADFLLPWITQDNQVVNLNAGQVIALGKRLAYEHESALVHQARALKDAVEAATTVEDVIAINLN